MFSKFIWKSCVDKNTKSAVLLYLVEVSQKKESLKKNNSKQNEKKNCGDILINDTERQFKIEKNLEIRLKIR